MGCIFDVDWGMGSAYHSVYYDYQYPPTWDDGYYYPDESGYWQDIGYYCWIVRDNFSRDLGSRSSVSAMTQGAFWYLNNPSEIEFHYAQTQTPPGVYAPVQSYAFLTAHNDSWFGDWD
jgi:hypothetical protein